MVPNREIAIELWWNDTLAGLPKNIKCQRATMMIYTARNIWKERNRRVFFMKETIRLKESLC
ncbi:hypothetical protein HU200_019424 [Digitaria exilis]|uniref:Uncharacterized protein n=1 Tax=Digitaria exilis TaxID=1010633 RepID=A0A835F322_9POAL|nr:hypothetical protein HU200_019424 [Digitaria exilis]